MYGYVRVCIVIAYRIKEAKQYFSGKEHFLRKALQRAMNSLMNELFNFYLEDTSDSMHYTCDLSLRFLVNQVLIHFERFCTRLIVEITTKIPLLIYANYTNVNVM